MVSDSLKTRLDRKGPRVRVAIYTTKVWTVNIVQQFHEKDGSVGF